MLEERVLVELSGENYDMGEAEAAALCAIAGYASPARAERDVVLVNAPGHSAIFHERMGLAHRTMRLLAEGERKEADRILEKAAELATDAVAGKTFSVAEHGLQDRPQDIEMGELKKQLGALIPAQVDLDHPDIRIEIWHGRKLYVGIVIGSVDRKKADGRKVDQRPFFSPISIHPKLARAMINLARAEKGETVFDPFCGTGGIVLEAADMGMSAVGSDIREDMINGTKDNLSHFGLAGNVFVHDVNTPVQDLKAHVLVTDPPYGKASKMIGSSMDGLVASCFTRAEELLENGRRMVLVLPNTAIIPESSNGFDLVERYELHVHGSLTRNFCVYLKT